MNAAPILTDFARTAICVSLVILPIAAVFVAFQLWSLKLRRTVVCSYASLFSH